jgi:hypothetical protein
MRLTTLAALALAGFSFCQPCLAAADPACTAEIKAIMLASVQSGPYHIEAKITGAGVDNVSTLDMVPPTAMHSVSIANGATTEMTFVDGRGFMKMSAVWSELPPDMSKTMTQVFDTQTVEQSFGSIAAAECAGATNWEGTSALRYVFKTGPDAGSSDITLWIDATTRLPIHIETVNAVNGQSITSIADYRYDPSIVITAPM